MKKLGLKSFLNYIELHKLKLIGEYEYVTTKTKITAHCRTINCKGIICKTFGSLRYKNSYFCKLCSNIIADARRKFTNIRKYGTPYTSQNNEIKRKIREKKILNKLKKNK